jgi:hypothetical protein
VHGYFGNGVWNGFEQANATKQLVGSAVGS